MKQYIISIIGATVLCAFSQLLTPATWQKYTKIVTGMIILSAIASPIMKIRGIDLFSDFSISNSGVNENIQIQLVAQELKKRVEEDIVTRIQNEFSESAEAEVEVRLSEKGEISGISQIKIKTRANPMKIILRMCEIYGTQKEEVLVYGYN